MEPLASARPPMTVDQDLEHLRLLSLFHYVAAGLVGLFTCIPLAQLVVAMTMVASLAQPSSDAWPGALVGAFLVTFTGIWVLLGTGLAVCLLLAGRYLRDHTHRTFCVATAAVSCAFMPIGTALGIFTILVLERPSVRARFAPSN